jgi:hypothetical protein
MTTKHDRLILLAIIALSVLLRVAVALFLGDSTPPAKDETSYSQLALRLSTGHGYSFAETWYPFAPADAPTAHWSFLYTAFVAAVYSVAGFHPLAARLAGAVLAGILFPLLLYRLSQRVFPPLPLTVNRFPFTIHHLSALLAAIYAYFILYSAMVQTEALFICALLWSLERALAVEQALRRGESPAWPAWLGLGVSLGLAALLRQSILPWAAVLFLWLLARALLAARAAGRSSAFPAFLRFPPFPSALLRLILAGLVIIAFILPFTLRNYAAYGDFLLLNSNAGYAMYSAQHPLHGTSFQEYAAAPLPEDLVPLGLNEAQWDKALMSRGIGFVLAEPGRYLLLSLSRVRDYIEFWPTADSSLLFNLGRLLSIGLFLPFMLYGLYLSLRPSRLTINRSPLTTNHFLLLYLFILVYSLLHIFTWAMSRYRLPVDAVLLLFAALALAELAGRWAARRALPVAQAD